MRPSATLRLSPEAVSTFAISLLRGGVLVVVQPSEGLPDAHRILRSADPANVRVPRSATRASIWPTGAPRPTRTTVGRLIPPVLASFVPA